MAVDVAYPSSHLLASLNEIPADVSITPASLLSRQLKRPSFSGLVLVMMRVKLQGCGLEKRIYPSDEELSPPPFLVHETSCSE